MASVEELLSDLEAVKTKVVDLGSTAVSDAEHAVVAALVAALEAQGYTVTPPTPQA